MIFDLFLLLLDMKTVFFCIELQIFLLYCIWDKVSKNGSSKICGRHPLKNLKGYGLKQTISFEFFKGCIPQILFGPFLSILSHLSQQLKGLKKIQLTT